MILECQFFQPCGIFVDPPSPSLVSSLLFPGSWALSSLPSPCQHSSLCYDTLVLGKSRLDHENQHHRQNSKVLVLLLKKNTIRYCPDAFGKGTSLKKSSVFIITITIIILIILMSSKFKQYHFCGFSFMKCTNQQGGGSNIQWYTFLSLLPQTITINYTALCKNDYIHCRARLPLSHPQNHPREVKKKIRCVAITGRLCSVKQESRNWLQTAIFGAKEVTAGAYARASVIHCRIGHPADAQGELDSWTGCVDALVKILSFLWASFLSHSVVRGVYARFRLPSRFRKLLGLSFISANWIEYSWPFQWNQLTPCKKIRALWVSFQLETCLWIITI